MNARTDLSRYNNDWYQPGGSALGRLLWYFVNALVFRSYLFPVNFLKTGLLRAFGAEVGIGVVIKPGVNIKYPWNLHIGPYTWIGEGVWIDNLALVHIGSHACLSQGAMLLCGSHDYKRSTFDLLVKPITLEDGVWIGAQALVCPGVAAQSHAVLAAGSVAASGTLEAYTVYQGNPAQPKRSRTVSA